jgi:exodeoxyribonuclease VII small subunit
MTTPSPDQLSFEQALAELDRIVRDLEDGDTDLEASLARYEQGVGLLKHCFGKLREAEQRVLLVSSVDEEGQPVLQPFPHVPTADLKRPRKKPEDPKGSSY